MDRDYGFIITRHVNSEKTNKYWNNCVILLRNFYPTKNIIIIDDNSNYEFVKKQHEYEDIIEIKSEFPRRGELLPFYYFWKNKYFENAIFIHDSVFIHKKILFEKLIGIDILPLWHFEPDNENITNILRIINVLQNNWEITERITKSNMVLGLPQYKTLGCFGCQCFINHSFLSMIVKRFQLFRMIPLILCRRDRCSLERILGTIFSISKSKNNKIKSLFGNIFTTQKWSYSFDDYMKDLNDKKINKGIIKVWTGR